MGVYSFLLSVFFIVAFVVVGGSVSTNGWRAAWTQLAELLVFIIAPFSLLFLRERSGPDVSQENAATELSLVGNRRESLTLLEALRSPAFWVFGLATALFALVSAGLGLFNEAVLAEHGFDQKTFHNFLAVTTAAGLIGQLVCGWLALRTQLRRLLGIAMLFYSVALAMLPFVKSFAHLWTFASLIGITGGFITVLFFAIWSHAFGRAHLGRIQGAAQLLTVFASAVGPLLFAKCASATGSYTPLLIGLAVVVLAIGVAAWNVTLPEPTRAGSPAVVTGAKTQQMPA
jgi:predicted MFS family arabinose efflux permease